MEKEKKERSKQGVGISGAMRQRTDHRLNLFRYLNPKPYFVERQLPLRTQRLIRPSHSMLAVSNVRELPQLSFDPDPLGVMP